MSISEDHLRLLKQQATLVNQLKDVLATQQRALEELGAIDEDYESAPTKDYAGMDSDNEGELTMLDQDSLKAEARTRSDAAVDSNEKKEPDEEWKEPDEEAERGFMAVKPWLGAMAPPSNWSREESRKRDECPNVSLDLEHVHGYRSRGCRDNIAYVDDDKIVFPVAAVCVIMQASTNKQIFYRGHTEDVLSLDYNPVKRIVASGEQGKKPKLCVWSVDNPSETRAVFTTHKRAVVAVNISPDGNRVVSVGLDNDHSISVHDIGSQSLISHFKGDTARILACYWNQTATANSAEDFVTIGSKHIVFWNVSGGKVDKKKGLLGRKGERQAFLSACFSATNTIVGCESGDLYFFEGHKLKSIASGHNKACFAVACDSTTNRLLSGGRDGFVNVWDLNTKKNVQTFDFNNEDACSGMNSIKSLYVDPKHPDTALVGTITNTIYEFTLKEHKAVAITRGHFGDLAQSHSYGEVWGLASHPTDGKVYVTAAEDRTLRVWNAETHQCTKRLDIGQKALSAAYHPSGNLIAVGFENGSFAVYNAADQFSEITRIRKTKKRIACIKFSPDGNTLAVGTASNRVYTFNVNVDENEVSYQHCMKGNCSVILHLDFSADSQYIQTCSQAYELLFYEVGSGNQVTRSRTLADVEWATFSSILGWSVQGIWPKESDGSDINEVNKSRAGNLLATADDEGLVKIFNYPCVGSGLDKKGKLRRRPECVSSLAHSEHVTGVQFTHNDEYLISTGGADQAVMQWKLNKA